MLEIATGSFPYNNNNKNNKKNNHNNMGFWDLLDYIVSQPIPLPSTRREINDDDDDDNNNKLSDLLCDFVSSCMQKKPEMRPSAEMVRLKKKIITSLLLSL